MAIKIHAFDTDADFQAAYNGSAYTEPWVSYTRANEEVNYSKNPLEEPLTFEILAGGEIAFYTSNNSFTTTIEYSKNDGEWTSITSASGASSPKISVARGDVVKFRGNNPTYSSGSVFNFFYCAQEYNIKGNIMSLIDSTNFPELTTLTATGTFRNFFSGSRVVDASKLILPAITIPDCAYYNMFSGCTSLTTAPELPATTIGTNCYNSMFKGCVSLISSPELPATRAENYSYNYMFSGCTSLVSGPSVLPATFVGAYGYSGMFAKCSSLTKSPDISATTLNLYSCYRMFDECSGMTVAPPILPSTSLGDSCYYQMFRVTSITTAPELPATTLTSSCYSGMFVSCQNLSYVKCLATDISAANCLNNWLNSVSSSGTFVKNPNMPLSSWSRGVHGIPTNWTVQDA